MVRSEGFLRSFRPSLLRLCREPGQGSPPVHSTSPKETQPQNQAHDTKSARAPRMAASWGNKSVFAQMCEGTWL